MHVVSCARGFNTCADHANRRLASVDRWRASRPGGGQPEVLGEHVGIAGPVFGIEHPAIARLYLADRDIGFQFIDAHDGPPFSMVLKEAWAGPPEARVRFFRPPYAVLDG